MRELSVVHTVEKYVWYNNYSPTDISVMALKVMALMNTIQNNTLGATVIVKFPMKVTV